MTMNPPLEMAGFLTDAWSRSTVSFARAMEEYHVRVQDGLQPQVPWLDFYNVYVQYNFVCWANIIYLLLTMALYMYMRKQSVGFRLRWVLVTYDAINVAAMTYVTIEILLYKYRHGNMLICNTLNNDADGHRLARIFVLFYAQKYFEFLDTWLFLLRKSFRQVTFLHLIYHSSITVVVGALMPFDYNGDMFLPILLNCVNHAFIYLHYLLATLGIQSWWASYITWMQLLQFVIIFAQSLVSYRIGSDCGTPDFAKVLMIVYMGSMISLYAHYILQRYVLRRPLASMFGVVKRPTLAADLYCSFCGSITLDDHGSCTILLPADFPDEEQLRRTTLLPISLLITYTLTPLGCAMPNLHIAQEVGRHEIQQKTLFKKSPAVKLTSGDHLQDMEQPMRLLVSVGQRDKEVRQQAHDRERTYASLLISWERNNESPPLKGRNVIKASSYSDLQNVHNDRLIDGPHGLFQADPSRRSKSNTALDELEELVDLAPATAVPVVPAVPVVVRSPPLPAIPERQAGLKERPSPSSSSRSNGLGLTVPSSSSGTNLSRSVATLPGAERPHGMMRSPSGREVPVPMSFQVHGGLPGGRVSWSIRVIPQRRRRGRTEDAANDGGTDGREEDWRAIAPY